MPLTRDGLTNMLQDNRRQILQTVGSQNDHLRKFMRHLLVPAIKLVNILAVIIGPAPQNSLRPRQQHHRQIGNRQGFFQQS